MLLSQVSNIVRNLRKNSKILAKLILWTSSKTISGWDIHEYKQLSGRNKHTTKLNRKYLIYLYIESYSLILFIIIFACWLPSLPVRIKPVSI